MTSCCEFHNLPNGCNQGRDCPERQQAPRSCEALGGCQHPERECSWACDRTPGLSVSYVGDELPDQELLRRRETLIFMAAVAALLLITLPLAAACIGYVWARWLA